MSWLKDKLSDFLELDKRDAVALARHTHLTGLLNVAVARGAAEVKRVDGVLAETKGEIAVHAAALDSLRGAHNDLTETIKGRVEGHVHETIAAMQSVKHRHVACPVCGKSYDLSSLGVPHSTPSVTISCSGCNNKFEVRPGLFWNKLEVERRA